MLFRCSTLERGETMEHLERKWNRNLSKVSVFPKINNFLLHSENILFFQDILILPRCRARPGGIAHTIIIVFVAKKRRDDF
jgi:hypothetical protein